MFTKLDICNKALSEVGKPSIASIDDNNSTARELKLHYDIARMALLERLDWPFARKTVQLSQIANETIPGWTWLYVRPPDCLMVRKILQTNAYKTDYGFEWVYTISPVTNIRAIACDEEDLYVQYTANITDPTQMDPLFIMAFAQYLASEIIFSLTGSVELKTAAEKEFAMRLAEATISIRNEERPPKDLRTHYVASRGFPYPYPYAQNGKNGEWPGV